MSLQKNGTKQKQMRALEQLMEKRLFEPRLPGYNSTNSALYCLHSCTKNKKVAKFCPRTGGPPLTQKSLTQFPLLWFLAYVRVSG